MNLAARQQLRDAVRTWIDISDVQFDTFLSIFVERENDRNAHVVLPGARSHELLFVCRGLLRFYYVDSDGSESNKAFVSSGEFAAPLAAHLDLPVSYGVRALETTSLLAAPYVEFIALFDLAPEFDRFGRKLAEYLLIQQAYAGWLADSKALERQFASTKEET